MKTLQFSINLWVANREGMMMSPMIIGAGTGRSDRSIGTMRITKGKKTKTIRRKKIEAWICYLDL